MNILVVWHKQSNMALANNEMQCISFITIIPTLAQVMACCLMAPSHYLNQCDGLGVRITFSCGLFWCNVCPFDPYPLRLLCWQFGVILYNSVIASILVKQATGLDAWASRVKCPARFVSHLHDICIYIWVVYSFCLFCCLFIIVTAQFVALYKPCKPKPKFR